MATTKVHTIIKTRRGQETEISNTLENLIDYFSYTLKCGNSYNSKINCNPKTVAGLVSALNKSVAETMGSCYDPDYYELKK